MREGGEREKVGDTEIDRERGWGERDGMHKETETESNRADDDRQKNVWQAKEISIVSELKSHPPLIATSR